MARSSVDLSGIARAAALVAKRAGDVDTIVQRARATLARRLPVEARRDIQGEYLLKATRVREAITTRNQGDAVELTASGRGVTLGNFRVTGGRNRKPLKAQILVGGSMELYPDRFIATGLGGSPLVFERSAKPKRRMTAGVNVGQLKEPLVVEYGPSVAQMLRRPDRRDRLAQFGQKILADEIQRLLR